MIELKIPGPPMGKQRPIVTRRGAFTPKKTVNYENYVKELYIINKFPKLEGYISMSVKAYYPIPKSTGKKRKEMMLQGILLPDKKPDCDNILKCIADSLNTIAYDDDKQIVHMDIEKYYSEEPHVLIRLEKAHGEGE